MTKKKSWEVTDDFCKRVESLIPIRQRLADHTYARLARIVVSAYCVESVNVMHCWALTSPDNPALW